jgi:hypothetical protein
MKSILPYKLYTKLKFYFRKNGRRTKCYLFAEIYGLGMAVKERSRNLSQWTDGWMDAQCAQSLAVSRGDQSALAGSEGVFVNLDVA